MKLKLLAGAAVAGVFAAAGAYAAAGGQRLVRSYRRRRPTRRCLCDTTSQFWQFAGGPPANLTVFNNDELRRLRAGRLQDLAARPGRAGSGLSPGRPAQRARATLHRSPGAAASTASATFFSVPSGSPARRRRATTTPGRRWATCCSTSCPTARSIPSSAAASASRTCGSAMNGRMNGTPRHRRTWWSTAPRHQFAYQGIFGLAIGSTTS